MKRVTIFIFLLLIFSHSIALAVDVPAEDDKIKILKIDVIGNENIDTGFVLNNIKIKEGDAFDINKIRDDMKSIYKTGYFSDVQVDVKDIDKGKSVTFVVIERPLVSAVNIDGNKKIKTDEIIEKLKVRAGSVLNIDKIKTSAEEIKKLYASKAYYAAKVTYDVSYQEGYKAAVTFNIDEPQQAYITKIAFKGNKAFKASKLESVMRTKTKGMFSWFTGTGILEEDTLNDDRRNLEAFYQDNGYVRAKIGTSDIAVSKDGKSITITIPIEEGHLFKTGKIDFSGDITFNKDSMLKKMKFKPGDTFRASILQQDMLTLTDFYQDEGYAFCDITPLTSINDENFTVDTTFDIKKGREIYFNRINIIGNTKTRDKVVRRELKFAEGDRFSATKMKDSKKRLTNTTYFKSTDFKLVKTDEPDKVNLDLSVEEKPTGTLSMGIGYSTYDKAILSGSISQENFLGTGRKLILSAAISGVTQEFDFTYLDPYIFDMNLGAGFSLFNYKRVMDTYDYKKQGGSVSLTRPITDDVRVGTSYRLENVDVTNIDDSASLYVKEQEGSRTTSSVTANISKNTIDNILDPRKGINSFLSLEVAGGPFGGDNEFIKTIGFYGKYIPAGFFDSAFFVKGTAGMIRPYGGKGIPIYEKFYVGGLNSVRGFKYGEAGPMDDQDEVLGGKNELFFNAEWIFPILKSAGLKGVLFYDLGAGFDDSQGFLFRGLRSGAGFGIRWFSPLGPIRLELGFNLFPKKDEKKSVFDFAIGTQY